MLPPQYCVTGPRWVNSLAPRRFQLNIRKVIFKLTLVNGGWGISYEIALRWMPHDLTDDKSTLIQVMAWCRQATSHYLSQCWPRSMSPNGVIRPQSWWRHQIEYFSALLALCAGIHQSPVNSPHKGQWRGALMFSLICAWINGWVNTREAGDLWRYRAHYDVTVMELTKQ